MGIPSVGAVLVALAMIAGAASTVTIRERARLREGPSTTSALLGSLPAGTEIQVLGDERGWKKVQTADGQSGWVWGEHLGDDPPPESARRTDPPAGPHSAADELRELRSDIATLRDRPPAATAADLERLRSEIDRLATAERDLARRLDDRMLPGGPLDPPGEHPFPATPIAFVVGAFVGLALARLLRRRRDRRQRGRLAY